MPTQFKRKVAISVVALVVLFLFWIVFNKRFSDEVETTQTSQNNQEIPETDVAKLLKDSLVISENPKNYSNFALRLADFYIKEGRYDSAAKYQELVAQRFPNEENWTSAGLTYYKAFKNATGIEQEQLFALRAIKCLEESITSDTSPKVKKKLAELYLASEKPDKAIALLKEIVSSNPNEEEALYLLGIHAFQLNAYEDARNYLAQVVALDSTDVNACYYLAVCEMKTGNMAKAKMLFEKVKQLDSSEEVKANADAYLNDIK
ncbi:MAG: tetratricopeptide repeat protein [Cyclobacteriaceae bacterium]|nr:tetratricopeptide repeat protein [Cyclobacteriaceae bacterium]